MSLDPAAVWHTPEEAAVLAQALSMMKENAADPSSKYRANELLVELYGKLEKGPNAMERFGVAMEKRKREMMGERIQVN